MRLRQYRYLTKSQLFYSGVTTVSIGNLQMGGGGKTPFALELLERMTTKKINFLYSTRAYKSKVESKGLIVTPNIDTPTPCGADIVGDEPALILQRIKKGFFLLGKNRSYLIQELSKKFLKKNYFETLVLEDAFQHLAIDRDIDLLMIDTTCPVEQFKVFPVGALREPHSQLWRADYIILNKTNQISSEKLKEWQKFINCSKKDSTLVAEIDYVCQTMCSLDDTHDKPISDFKNKNVVLFSAIANPKSFELLMASAGLNILAVHQLPDHSSFSSSKMSKMLDYATQNDAFVICTEKDAVKLKQNLNSDRIYYAKLELKLSSAGEGPWNWLLNCIQE